ncbi:alpha-L-fucosidase [Geosmithia morbida]|uniref:alpha-L-fucosidase n=1 Tax=Geosmithia morbida TaxID=1094350 RepID=A0A9P4YRI0_9HYPO|nr:alpha-L-fucosidase [Geosmithia morbida]KAF4120745.1 alpha-L-fucosidase [Geosmithia morbida]
MKLKSIVSSALSSLPLALGGSVHSHSLEIPLDQYFNNKGFGSYPGEAALSTLNESLPAAPVGQDGIYTSTSTGVSYLFPGYNPDADAQDNVICAGQTITVPPSSSYFAASFLLVSDVMSSTVSDSITLVYSDNTTSTTEVRAPAFWWFLTLRRGQITLPFFFTNNGTNGNASEIYETHAPVESGKDLRAIVLPDTTNSTSGRLHLFSLSLWDAGDAGISVQTVRPTQNWDGHGRQVVEAIVNHHGAECVSGMKVFVDAPQVYTPEPTLVKSNGTATVTVTVPHRRPVRVTFPDVAVGLRKWTPDADSLVEHEPPQWYDGAKFGIFIHWGPYAVPGWGNSTPNECYSEWFWWYSTRINEQAVADRCGVNAYRLRTFGPDLAYDDFFANFTASVFDPKAWVDLFADAGAQYFVFTTKHHDGFANFDTGATSNRSSLHLGPRRDILRELFDAAETYQPHLKRGTYFSLPEWFNPDWGKYGFTQFDKPSSTSFPGIIARNPYTGNIEPYTGRVPAEDFIDDLMVPQMDILAYQYNTDIMWCDAGAANGTDAFAARWFNWARDQGRQVAINDRCGSTWSADFDTPEYETFSVAQRRKWESNQGMDPYSYGYNRATAADEYMNATTLIHNLVDMASKNGNLLLNIGPRADGSIHEAMISSLREAGSWLHAHDEAIFNTTYWYPTPEERSIRFTQTNDAFYLLSLDRPVPGRLVVEAPVPAQKGDRVAALTMDGEVDMEWGLDDGGSFWIEVSNDIVERDSICWVFRVQYK